MAGWNEGYVTDIPYTFGFYRELSPAFLDFLCLLRGQRPPETAGGFAYCELGCGQGFGTNLLAAACPEGRFWGFDFNPAQVAHANGLAAAIGQGNAVFREDSFAELAAGSADALPAFDYIVLHGIYSWISPANRQAIVRFIGRRLKPGGIAYVSYNCLPGWAQTLPLQRLLREQAARLPGRSDARMRQALEFVGRLQATEARYFRDNAGVPTRLESLAKHNANYLSHEYLNGDWNPLFHADVAEEMAAAKLSYLGSAMLSDNMDAILMNSAMREMLAAAPDQVMAETMRDFYVNRQFRRDVYIRGPAPLPDVELRERQDRLPVALTVPRGAVALEFATAMGTAQAPPEIYGPIADLLAEAPRGLASLAGEPRLAGQSPLQLLEAVAMFMGAGHAHPALGPAGAKAWPANAAIIRRVMAGTEYGYLAAPAVGTAIPAEFVEMAAALALAEFPALEADTHALAVPVWRRLQAAGRVLQLDGRPLRDAEANQRQLATALLPRFLSETLPLWRRLGAV